MEMKVFTKITAAATFGAVMFAAPAVVLAGDCGWKGMKSAHDGSGYTKAYMQGSAATNQGGFYKTGNYAAKKTAMSAMPDIIDTAVSAGSFNTLVTAVKAAGLVETLKGDGPYTVFAPTDEAFAKVPKATLDALLADKEALRKVLLYHVVPGKVSSSDVVKLTSAKTAQGSSVTINATDGVMIDNAKVVKADIETSNGIIHVIDSVILPQS